MWSQKLQASIEKCFAEIDVRRKNVLHYNSFLKNIYKGDQFYEI